jgi:hypothetical protein
MGKTNDEIESLYEDLRKMRAPYMIAAQQVANVYDGDIRLPMPEIDKIDMPAVANLVVQGVDAYGQRIASTMPFPEFDIQTNTNVGRERARQRNDLMEKWWDDNMLDVRLGTVGRHFVAYGSTMMVIKPHMKKKVPEFVVLDPIDTFPVGDDVHTEAGIHVHRKSRRWCQQRYGDASKLLSRNPRPQDEIELIEYCDDMEWVVLGRQVAHDQSNVRDQSFGVVRLATIQNYAGTCPLVAIGRPGLTKPMSQFAGSLGMYVQRAMLQAYDLIGVRMSVMPKTWIVGRANETPAVLQMPDALNGQPGIVTGGSVEQLFPQPSQQLPVAIDRLERGERIQSGVMAEMGGEAASNIRTGRRGDQVMSATVDFPVQEAQKWIARMLREVDKIAIATDAGYWGGSSKSFYVSRQGSEEKITYDPDKLWKDADGELIDRHTVSYAHPGADVNGLIVGIGQSIGLDIMSHRTGMRQHPQIEDPEFEHDQIVYEKLETLGLNVLEQQASQGQVEWSDLVGIMKAVRMDKTELVDALVAQQKAAQQRQAEQAAQQAAQAAQAAPGPPGAEQMPGMGAGGGPTPTEEVPGGGPSLGPLGKLLQTVKLPSSAQAPGIPNSPAMSGA